MPEDHRTSQLQTWLSLSTAREQRRYLESHRGLLDKQSETILSEHFIQTPQGSGQSQQMRRALLLLQDARRRGGSAEAVRQAYINIHGGLVLDIPPSLEFAEQRLSDLLREKRLEETAEARVALLEETGKQSQNSSELAPELVASLLLELADAWRTHPRTDRSQAIEKTIEICERVLSLFTLEHYPYQYAKAQNILGNAYADRIVGERRENYERAIACQQEALRVRTLDAFPSEYALTKSNLGTLYGERVAGKRRENVEQAIACFREALQVYTLDGFPFEHAKTQHNLGTAYDHRIAGERRENVEQAIACFREALRVRTLDAFPFYYATTQNNLGNEYKDRIEGNHQENLEQAIACFREALRVRTLDAFPFHYASTQHNLGEAYTKRLAGERWKNLELAIACYHETLRVWTADAFPFQHAMTQNNLGRAYNERIAGDQQENQELAISCQQKALSIYTLEAMPFYYAEVQNDLGNVYRQRIAGDQRENLEQAITCYHEALHVYMVGEVPRESRAVYLGIAETEAQRGNWKAARDAYMAALEAEDLLMILGAGIVGRDAILKEGRDAATRFGYTLHRLDKISDAAVAIERGRARGLAEAMLLNAGNPALITNEERRTRYIAARMALITAQEDLHTPVQQDLDEETRRRLNLAYTAAYRHARSAFDTCVAEIRAAHDPADFLNAPLDATTILQVAERIGPEHALVYLAATPWGGFAVAALRAPQDTSARFISIDIPSLTEEWVKTLIETHLKERSERLIGGYALAQIGDGFEEICRQWDGETFLAKVRALSLACQMTKQESTLEAAAQELIEHSPLRSLTEQPLASLKREERSLLRTTFNYLFLQQELTRCLEPLGKTVMQPLMTWLGEQGVKSLTLIPCGHLATFPLATIVLPDGRSVGETCPTSLAPSARSLLHNTSTRAIQAGVYALGDPQQNLPWSEAEALTLTALVRRFALPAEAHVKQQATRERLLSALEKSWMVDASCHGIFHQEDFLRSALCLAKGESITMSEMLSHQVDLRGLRLLLLSACQTAIFDLQGARDEVHSLAAATLQAGAQAVLATQWAVDDKATYLLIIRFIQEWLPYIEQESPAPALARAQTWLRNVTNAELAHWQSLIPVFSDVKPLTRDFTSVSRDPEIVPRRWQSMPVRGRYGRYLEDDAQLVIRVGAEENDPAAHPYANPYYWAGFQVIGW